MDPRVTSRVVACATDLALVVDGEGVIVEVWPGEVIEAHSTWNGLVGKRWRETIAVDSQSKVEPLLQEARGGRACRPRELNQKVEGLGEVPFRFSAVLFNDQQHVIALGRDLRPLATMQQRMVSSQQAMDREYARVRQADTRYRVLFQVCAEGAVVADAASGKIIEVNPAAASLLGEPAKALQVKTLRDLFDARSWPAMQSLLAGVDAGARPADIRVGLQGRKESDVTASVALFRQADAALVLLRFWLSGVASSPGGARNSRMLAVLDSMPDGFVIIGEDRRILSANAAFCELVQQANENQVVGQPLDRWLGRPGVDLPIMIANLREHRSVRNFATIVRGDFGSPQEGLVTAVSAVDGKFACFGFTIRTVSSRLGNAHAPPSTPRSVEQLRELVGRVSLKDLVRESADLIERLCIEAALDVSGNNRASAAQLLGLSRQGLYSKLRRHGLEA